MLPITALRTTFPTVRQTHPQQPVDTAAVASAQTAADGFDALPQAPLRRGQNGAAVKKLQHALIDLKLMTRDGYQTGPGIFGPRTEAALEVFQRRHGLPVNGVFTEATRRAMAKALQRSSDAGGPTKPKRDYDADKGTPMYDQDSAPWGDNPLGNKKLTIAQAGCALTATAMAISRISGRRINPGQLDRWCDNHGGYIGNNLDWADAARARGLTASRPKFSLERIDKNLLQNRPVVIGVSYAGGKNNGGANGTDHWLTVTARRTDERGRRYYVAHDPGTGRQIRLYPGKTAFGWGLKNDLYKTTAQLRTFHKP